VDRRGLPEIATWLTLLVTTGVVTIVAMATHSPGAPYALFTFLGLATAAVGRGTKGAMDRDALRDQVREQIEADARKQLAQRPPA